MLSSKREKLHLIMAKPPTFAAKAKSDNVIDVKNSEYALIGRYFFSRSICHRLDEQDAPLASVQSPKLPIEGGSKRAASRTHASCPSSPASRPKLFRKFRSGPLLRRSNLGLIPSLRVSLSFPSLKINRGRSEAWIDTKRNDDDNCASSWSQLFDDSRGENAVLSSEHWMVDMSQLLLGGKFASGTYSRLYHGLYKDKEVAVKVKRPPDGDEEIAQRLERQFCREVSLLVRLHHQNVVQFMAACKEPPAYCVVTEYLSKGSLRSFLNKIGPVSLPRKVGVEMALDIARGMEYLHSQGIIHRDLKSENLCLDNDLCVKITDFGVSCHYAECNNFIKDTGTYRWMAPEMISHKRCTKKIDVYSFGIVLWELCTGLTPFEEMSAVQAAFAVVNKHARPAIPPDCPRILSELMRQCWSANADRRPDFWEIVKRLEKIEDLSKQDISFNAWQHPSRRTSSFISKCFTVCR